MLKKVVLNVIAFLFIIGNVFSQQPFQGTIVDSKTQKPIPYASIKVKNNKKIQSVANADGRFSLSFELFSVQDTITISCVGYSRKSIPVISLATSPLIKLHPLIYQLNPVNISSRGNVEFPYKLFYELCQKYRKYGNIEHSKGYFSFLSHSDESPLEIIEGYFNADVACKNGISQLKLKNSRMGLCPNNFYSLNTTDIITHFSPFSLTGNLNIPSSAGNFSYHRLRKLFDIQIIQTSVEDGNKKMVLQFIARKDSTTLFSGIAWINFTEKTIEQLYFSIRDNSFFYLQPIFEGDKTDLTQVSLGFTFDNSDKGHPVIDRVSLDYSLIYTSLRLNNTIKIASEGNLILYDYSNPFPEILPKGLLESQVNDYQKISCLPYDSVFWSSQIVTPQSDKQKSFIDYFRSNGILVNFSKSLDSITGSNYIHWSANSDVSFIDIPNKAPSPKNHSLSIGMLPSVNAPDYPPCDVICKIIVNPLNMIDSLHLSSITLLNRTDSYYLLGNSLKATVFINLVFDLYEEQRRELVTTCNQLNKLHKLNLDEFQFIYSKALKQGNDTINIFKAETENGTSFEELDSWYSVISAKIGVDRCSLIQKMENEEALAEQVKMNTISEEDKFMKE